MDVLLANLGWVPSPAEPDGDAHALATRGGPGGVAVLLRLVDALGAARHRLPRGFEARLVLASLQDIGGVRARLEAAGFAVEADASRLRDAALVLLRARLA